MSTPTPAIFAHRGASHYAPENTLAAFEIALQQQADGIELDVQLTADDQVVVIHDALLNRTTDGSGKVSQQTLKEIRQWDAGEGLKIPTLEEVLALIGDQAILNIELKRSSRKADQLPKVIIDLIQKYGLAHSVLLSSFDPYLLLCSRQVMPEIRLGILYSPGLAGHLKNNMYSPRIQPYSLHPHYSLVTPHLLESARERGQVVYAWTVNKPKKMRKLFAMGIDGIITDDPLTARKIREDGS